MATSRTGTSSYKQWRLKVLRNGQLNGITHCPMPRCRVPLDYTIGKRPNSAEPDHIIPHARGGQDIVENGRVICRKCNQSIGDKRPRARKQKIETIDFT